MRYDRFDLAPEVYTPMYDPRDYIFHSLYGRDWVDANSVIAGHLGFDPGLEQLLLMEFEEQGWLKTDESGVLLLTSEGASLSEARLDCWPSWGQAMVRPDAPPLPEISPRLRVALSGYVLRNDGAWPGVMFEKCLN